MGGIIEEFVNIYKFCNNDIHKFIFLLRENVYLYEYMDRWERFVEKSLPDKKGFYSELILEDITDEDYIHAQKVFEELKIKKVGEYNDLPVQSDTLFLADVFQNFRINVLKYLSLILLIFHLHLN